VTSKAKNAAGWIAVGLITLGQLLPWGYRDRPIGQAWDSLFSRVSRPNAEWWIWFLAPVAAAALAARSLLRKGKVDQIVLLPVGIFLLTWGALFLTGVRRYLHFTQFSILLTFAGLLLLAAVALLRD
jgi:hypothetical protein